MTENKGILVSVSQLFQSIRDIFPEIRLRHFAYTFVFLFLLLIVGLFIFESISGYFYFNRVENRVNSLKELASIDINRLKADPELDKLYKQTVIELKIYQIRSISSIPFEIQSSLFGDQNLWTQILKFITGGFLWFLILLVPLFNEEEKNRIGGVIVMGCIGIIFGFIGILIPSISPWVNYIGYPFAQLTIILIMIGTAIFFSKKN
ncbi:hypothetical protein [Leptospira licerasiae]|uniref:Uncharacterized protein n=1 Tax=Leptospira licerasiae str. MMD4847 TaxID=1049971 RepID=A0ABN0HDP2_9LEPT|nr:hypothetical protein [Leptospira licerasiae]EIE03477.1 hypothetical protein LEP1GSC185_3540 [Leptospira licerasiae serovar Varillal str. VAR 010]EJZ43692.1 hypothetical protein LEP1GSC178_2354 [Leptospira licerasiae str. MMD4847]